MKAATKHYQYSATQKTGVMHIGTFIQSKLRPMRGLVVLAAFAYASRLHDCLKQTETELGKLWRAHWTQQMDAFQLQM